MNVIQLSRKLYCDLFTRESDDVESWKATFWIFQAIFLLVVTFSFSPTHTENPIDVQFISCEQFLTAIATYICRVQFSIFPHLSVSLFTYMTTSKKKNEKEFSGRFIVAKLSRLALFSFLFSLYLSYYVCHSSSTLTITGYSNF